MAVDRADGPSNVKDGPPRPLRKKCGRQRVVSEALMAPPEGRKPYATSEARLRRTGTIRLRRRFSALYGHLQIGSDAVPCLDWPFPAALGAPRRVYGDTRRSRASVLQGFLYACLEEARGGAWKIATGLLGINESSVADEARDQPAPYRLTTWLPDGL